MKVAFSVYATYGTKYDIDILKDDIIKVYYQYNIPERVCASIVIYENKPHIGRSFYIDLWTILNIQYLYKSHPKKVVDKLIFRISRNQGWNNTISYNSFINTSFQAVRYIDEFENNNAKIIYENFSKTPVYCIEYNNKFYIFTKNMG